MKKMAIATKSISGKNSHVKKKKHKMSIRYYHIIIKSKTAIS